MREPIIYFFGMGLVEGGEGARLENLAAVSLLSYVHRRTNESGVVSRLHYLRTKNDREVDFCVAEQDRVKAILEVKTGDSSFHRPLKYFHSRYGFKAVQIVRHLKRERVEGEVEIVDAEAFLGGLVL
jgi:predicted AAA+ superfamily ATPase